MEKTKLGISVTLMAIAVCLLGYYGGYMITGILVGYVLLMEENAYLKRLAVKVLAALLAFSLVSTVLHLIPSGVSMLRSLIYVFDDAAYSDAYYNNSFNRFVDFVSNVLSFVKTVVFLLLTVCAAKGEDLKIPVLDAYLDKHLNENPTEPLNENLEEAPAEQEN